jgi:hypothetical protein
MTPPLKGGFFILKYFIYFIDIFYIFIYTYKKQIYMNKKIINLINKVQKTFGNGSFEVKTENGDYNPLYDNGDLTKNYVEFIKDVIEEKFGEVTEKVVEQFGSTIQTDTNNFPPSTKSKPSTIKQITEEIFISTNMNSISMENMILDVAKTLKFKVNFNNPEEKGWGKGRVLEAFARQKSRTDVMMNEKIAYRIAVKNGWLEEAKQFIGTLKIFYDTEINEKMALLSKETKDKDGWMQSLDKLHKIKMKENYKLTPKELYINAIEEELEKTRMQEMYEVETESLPKNPKHGITPEQAREKKMKSM